jgi:putative transposase
MSINQPTSHSPPGFCGLRPDRPIKIYRRHLPHWRQVGATYFVTFRLADALPQSKLNELKLWREQWERTHPEPRREEDWEAYAKQYMMMVDRWMDEGAGECVFRNKECALILRDALLQFDVEHYHLFAFVVMPNHCHVVVQPSDDWELEKIIGRWKGFTGHAVNVKLCRTGSLWQEESYDRIVRDENHLRKVVRYIGRNPQKAGISEEKWMRWVCPEWEECGWGFE